MPKQNYDFIVVNFANADLVGHTGDLDAAIIGVEVIDECLGDLLENVKKYNGVAIITADHGKAEFMIDDLGRKMTQHTNDEVDFIVYNLKFEGKEGKEIKVKNGILADIAPTILKIMNIQQPKEMTGMVLI